MKKIKLTEFKKALSNWGELYIRDKDGFSKEGTLQKKKSRKSPKEFLLPREEVLFAIRKKGPEPLVLEANPSRKKVVMGALPCDMKGLSLTTKNFLQKPEDPYYKKRMENTLFVSEICQYPTNSCFCTSFDYGPSTKMGDITYFRLNDDTLLCEPLTDKGKKAISWSEYPEADKEDIEKMDKVLKNVEKKVDKLQFSYDFSKAREVFASQLLKEYVFSCLNCGACTFVCPTCYCFDIRDIERKDFALRERVWDSCMFFIYSLEASGHNPRKERAKRATNRFMHKFFYQPIQYNEFGCTGCGRCIDVCPAGYDIRETAKKVQSFMEE